MTQEEVGRQISEYRKMHGLTQQKLADRLSVSNKAISRWERGESLPDITILSDMAELFGVSIDTLLEGSVETQMPHTSSSIDKKHYKLYAVFAIVIAMLGTILMGCLVYGLGAIVFGVALAVVLLILSVVLLAFAIARIDGEWTRSAMRYTFLAAMIIVLSTAMILPVMLSIRRAFDYNIGEYVLSVMGKYTYIDIVLCIIPIVIYIYIRYERVYMCHLCRCDTNNANRYIIFGDSLLALGAIFFASMNMGSFSMRIGLIVIGVLCVVGNVVCSLISLISRHDATSIVYAVRNILLSIPVVMCYKLIEVVESGEGVAYYLAANYPLWIIFSMMCALILLESIVFIINEKKIVTQKWKNPYSLE